MKVLLVVIDGASPRVFCPAVQTGRLKHLNRLADAGQMHQASISIFPSITPAATAAIITGAYPAEHGIVGASWYDEERGQVVYYGDDFWVIAQKGFGSFLRDFLVHLNGDRLTAPTLSELVEESGAEAACLNYLVYRGLRQHRVNIPWLLSVLPGTPLTEVVQGPSTLYLGDFVTDGRSRHRAQGPHGALHRFGMDDAATASFLCEVAASGHFAEFTVAYFADNDFRSHEVGPYDALPVLDRADAALGAMFDAAGGFEHFLSQTCVIVTSDHGHCDIVDDKSAAGIPLADVLSEFAQAGLGAAWSDRDEIMICPNMRAAQIYLRDRTRMDCVTRAARADARIDQIMWRTPPAGEGAAGYRVATQRGDLAFWRAGDGGLHGSGIGAGGHGSGSGAGGGHEVRDAFGTPWRWEGEAGALGLDIDGGCVNSADYPNPFERIAGALDARNSGDLWLTARPGCEFEVPGGKAHAGGGSHGALHALDSLSPLIATGPIRLPRALRSVDVAPLCMEALGLPMRYAVGAPRQGKD